MSRVLLIMHIALMVTVAAITLAAGPAGVIFWVAGRARRGDATMSEERLAVGLILAGIVALILLGPLGWPFAFASLSLLISTI